MWKNIFLIGALSLMVHGLAIAAPGGAKAELENRLLELEAQVDLLLDLLAGVSRGIDPNTGFDTLQFSSMNVQINNGSNNNHTTNGTGNLIVGYNLMRPSNDCPDGFWCNRRSGSHNLISGDWQNYTSVYGLVMGTSNEISGNGASIVSGAQNTASGGLSFIGGGFGNTANNDYSSILGGERNIASGYVSTVSGGKDNLASGFKSYVGGGVSNEAGGWYSSVGGGNSKIAVAENCWEGDNTEDC